jgi:hypothetical protein
MQRTPERVDRTWMTLAPLLALVAVFFMACGGASTPSAASVDDELCTCRVPVEPFLEELDRTGQSLEHIVDVEALEDLEFLIEGESYRYVVLPDGRIRVAPIPASAENNAYVHPVLGDGQPVRGAGFLRREEGGALWSVDRNSQAYCPPRGSEQWAVEALLRIGVRRDGIGVVQIDPDCVDPRAPIPGRRDLIVR